ncbi:MAG: hypothetical protein KDE14_13020 [Rhodobacteraceae bacterium]|nr:hypothetical protein [Paracoccaceae bacterium]
MTIFVRAAMLVAVLCMTACAEGSGPSLMKSMCLTRENICKSQCDAMRAEQALACRQSCESSCSM